MTFTILFSFMKNQNEMTKRRLLFCFTLWKTKTKWQNDVYYFVFLYKKPKRNDKTTFTILFSFMKNQNEMTKWRLLFCFPLWKTKTKWQNDVYYFVFLYEKSKRNDKTTFTISFSFMKNQNEITNVIFAVVFKMVPITMYRSAIHVGKSENFISPTFLNIK